MKCNSTSVAVWLAYCFTVTARETTNERIFGSTREMKTQRMKLLKNLIVAFGVPTASHFLLTLLLFYHF